MLEHVIEGCQCEGKQCTKCDTVKCHGLFDVRREQGGKYIYLRNYCTACRKEQQKKRWHDNVEEIKARRRTQRLDRRDAINARLRKNHAIHGHIYNANKRAKRASDPEYAERVRAQQRASQQRHHETHIARLRDYRQRNLERLREYDRQRSSQHVKRYRQNYPERMKALDGRHHHKRRAQKKSAPGQFTSTHIREQLQRQRYRCYYLRCGQSSFPKDKKSAYGYRFTIEHIIPLNRTEFSPRNDMSNIVLVCTSCNSSKRDKLPHEWFEGGRLF